MAGPPLGFHIDLELDQELTAPDFTSAQVSRAMRDFALDVLAPYAITAWAAAAGKMGLHDSGGYVRGIVGADVVVRPTSVGMDNVGVEVVITNRAPHASVIEEGHRAFHLPDQINWGGPRVKHGKNGPYLHIPFGHRGFATAEVAERQGLTMATMKAMMPRAVHEKAKKLKPTIARREGPIQSPTRGWIAADRYHWGGRMKRGHVPTGFVGSPEGLFEERRSERTVAGRDASGNRLTNPAWQSSKFEGLFKSGGGRHTSYMTIRTITPHSAGWNIPAMQGRYIAQRLADELGRDETVQGMFASMMTQFEGQAVLAPDRFGRV